MTCFNPRRAWFNWGGRTGFTLKEPGLFLEVPQEKNRNKPGLILGGPGLVLGGSSLIPGGAGLIPGGSDLILGGHNLILGGIKLKKLTRGEPGLILGDQL